MSIFNPLGGSGGSSPYTGFTVYTALISQTGVAAPTVTILQDTITGLVWSYVGVGTYKVTKAGAFVQAKTWFTSKQDFNIFNNQSGAFLSLYELAWNDVNSLLLTTAVAFALDNVDSTTSVSPTDAILTNIPLEIRIYS